MGLLFHNKLISNWEVHWAVQFTSYIKCWQRSSGVRITSTTFLNPVIVLILFILISQLTVAACYFFSFLSKISNNLSSRCIFKEGSASAPSHCLFVGCLATEASIFFWLNILNLKRQQEDGQFALAATWKSPDVPWRDRRAHSEADNNEIILRWVTSLRRFTANHAQVRDLKNSRNGGLRHK